MGIYKRLSVKLLGDLADRTEGTFSYIKPYLMAANISVLLKTWVSMMFLTTILAYLISLSFTLGLLLFLGVESLTLFYYSLFIPIMVTSLTFLVFYTYPMQKAKSLKKSIENNLPFAMIHMNAISSSGIPPEFMFQLLSKFREYGEISNQAGMIVRNMNVFGMSSVNAINNVARRTSSEAFKHILTGISSTIEKGGNLNNYLKEMADKSLFNYRLDREKYVKTLSTYADIYTAVLIAAPLILISVFVMMSILGGDIFGLSTRDAIIIMIWIVIPALNIIFLTFIHVTRSST